MRILHPLSSVFLRSSIKIPVAAAVITAAVGSKCLADNPIVQTRYTADPAPMVYKDTVYCYTGHDEDGSTWFTMKDWRCYSSTDMVNWTDLGTPLAAKDFSWVKGDAWAGQCIERNGKFYYYVPMTQKRGGMAVGVAVSDSPTGPFKDALNRPLVTTGTGDIDPTVYIDDDGQAYLYWGNPRLWYVKLNKDMISFDTTIGKNGIVEVPLTAEGFGKRERDPKRATLYEEGPWFYKRNNLYYMVFAASGIPENICYSTSTSPTGPWTFKGIVIPQQGRSFTDHAGVIDYKGHSYMFYHNGALPGGGGFTRSTGVEEFKYNADGTFPTINMTEAGPQPLCNLNPFVRTEAETIAFSAGVKTTQRPDRSVYVTNLHDGSYIKVRSVDFTDKGARKFSANVAGAAKGATIEIRLDSQSGPVVGTLKVKPTGAAEKWKTQTCKISGVKGVHDVFFRFTADAAEPLNFDWWQFKK